MRAETLIRPSDEQVRAELPLALRRVRELFPDAWQVRVEVVPQEGGPAAFEITNRVETDG